MRLIDADSLETHEIYEGEWVRVVYADDIDNAPTIDAEPVRHGRWIERKSYPGVACYCSECNYKNYGRPYQNTYFIVPYNFCPNCGAKMDWDWEKE